MQAPRNAVESADVAGRIRRAAAAVAATVAFVASGTAASAAEVGGPVRLPAVQLLDGRTLTPAQLAGKPLIVQVWASWCPYCALQNPRLQKLMERTRGTPLQVLTISIDKTPEQAQAYLHRHGYTFPVAMDTPALRAALGPRKGLPELYVIDATGRVVRKEVGEMLEEEVEALSRYARAS